MNSVIGLLENEAAVPPALQRLEEAGIPKGRIELLSNLDTVNKLLGCDPMCVVTRYAAWGASFGVAFYAVFGLAAAFCECGLMQYGQKYGIFAFLGAVLSGAFIGGFLGTILGIGESERGTHLYVQGVRVGGKVIAIQVPDEELEAVKALLVAENILGVKALQPEGG